MARLPQVFEGDLRPVTILFADVRGFTRLSEVLPPTARRVVHVAAVLGHAFPATLLRSVLGAGEWRAVLARLEEQGTFVRESRARGDGSGATWFWYFRHPLVQETVYASLLSATRSGLHRAAGEALES